MTLDPQQGVSMSMRCGAMAVVVRLLVVAVAWRSETRIGGRRRPIHRQRQLQMGGEGDIKAWFRENGFGDVAKRGSSFGGSGWSSTAKWVSTDSQEAFFVKTSSKACNSMFLGEAQGLTAMRLAAEASPEPRLKIPKVYHCADYDGPGRGSFIIMEFLNMGGRGDQVEFGKALAHMHLAEPVDPMAKGGKFGFTVDNTCGATPQPNEWYDSWPDFFRDQRLKHQMNLAGDAAIDRLGEALLPRIHEFFDDQVPIRPSIIHGDLWSGNIGTADGAPSIFDPACYYGSHEAEWGMSWCASLGPKFWEGYRSVIPEDPGFQKRRPLYELYHQLNHYNLFGGGYRAFCDGASFFY